MQENPFKIYIDRLRHGEVEKIALTLSPEFLDIQETELQFKSPVEIRGEVYLAEGELILHFHIITEARLPCAICNESTAVPVDIKKFYFTKPVTEITSHIFDFSKEVREAILLEVPFIVECCEGKCPSRKELAEYLAPPLNDEEGWQPFKDL